MSAGENLRSNNARLEKPVTEQGAQCKMSSDRQFETLESAKPIYHASETGMKRTLTAIKGQPPIHPGVQRHVRGPPEGTP